MPFGHLVDVFWTPFGCLLDPGTSLYVIFSFFEFVVILGAFRPPKGSPIWTPNPSFWRVFGDTFFVVFWLPYLFYFLWFWAPFGRLFDMLFGRSWSLGNGTKTLKGVWFSYFGLPFCRHDFKARFTDWLFADSRNFQLILAVHFETFWAWNAWNY